MGKPTCAIISLFHNCLSRSDIFLRNLKEATSYPHKLFFINNGSKDATQKLLLSVKNATVIHTDVNIGVAAGRNLGIKTVIDNHPDCEYVCFLDNDVDLSEKWLDELISVIERNHSIGLVGPVTNSTDNPVQDTGHKRKLPKKMFVLEAGFSKEEFIIANRIDGFCMIIHRNVLNNIGYFDSDFSTIGYESWDYCRRAKEAGYACAVRLRTFVMHDGGYTIKENKMGNNFYQVNKQRYMMKWENIDRVSPPSVFIPLTNVNNNINIEATEKINYKAPLQHKKDYSGRYTPSRSEIRTDTDLTLACYIKLADGLGQIGVKLFEELMKKNLKINHKRLNVYDLDGVSQTTQENLNKYSIPSNVLLLTNQAFYLDGIENKNRTYLYTMFESTRIPADWVSRINQRIDEVFVPDSFQKRAFIDSGVTKPITIVPLAVNHSYSYKPRVDDGVFTFGFSGMFTQRKNIHDLIKAFRQAFPVESHPNMRLKVHGRWGTCPNSKKQFSLVIGNDKRIQVDEGVLSNDVFKKWWETIDCYIFPSKGEGFSLTPREAIAQGIPTIVSNYSGHEILVSSGHFYPIQPCGEEPAFYEFINQTCGNQAKINVNDIVNVMKYVYEHYDEALNKAKNGSEWIKTQPSWKEFAENILHEIFPENIMVCDTLNKQCGIGEYTGHIVKSMKNDKIKFMNNLEHAIKIIQCGKTKRIHIQHEYSIYGGKPFEHWLQICKNNKVKVSITMHSVAEGPGLNYFNKSICELADEIFVLNPLAIRTLERANKNAADKIKFIHHYCYTDIPFKKLPVRKGLIGTFGFLHPQKGFNYLIEAIANTPYTLRMVCTGDPNHPKFIAPYRQNTRIEHYHNFLPFDQILSLLSECELIIFPSVNHDSGMLSASGSVRVGIATGRPIICTTATHFSEFSQEIPKVLQRNVLDLKDKITILMSDEKKQSEIIEKLSQYSKEHSLEKTAEFFRQHFSR